MDVGCGSGRMPRNPWLKEQVHAIEENQEVGNTVHLGESCRAIFIQSIYDSFLYPMRRKLDLDYREQYLVFG